ncbi:poly(ADP-ribose) glycohydrolase-like [Amphiura filiformis]|uniref:poly(ADP-ribose) glycohydrolase-like n=1 Tax=Amphiura filiformis TaxID=82378 RepID=UPI003B20DE44
MVQLALQLPKLCTKAIQLLRRQQNHSISLTQQQVASLLANGFFCTYPRRNAQQRRSEYSTFPTINFNGLFEGTSPRKIAKLKCIVNYFRRIVENIPTGTLTFTRCALTKLPRWDKSTAAWTKCHVTASGMIEDEGAGMLQMDFANKFIGGGVLSYGCVQEEIRFSICPELLLSRLFTEVPDENECIFIKGAERFSCYAGYADTFKWTGNFVDNTPRDKWGRIETEIVALDALVFHSYAAQFKPELIRRELNKAYCGFHSEGTPPQNIPALATGNWGCGAFGGDTRLKGLLQMMAAAECQRQVCYFTFGDKVLCDDLNAMHQLLMSSGVTVGDLWNTLQKYRLDTKNKKKKVPKLFPYIYQLYSDYQLSTEDETEANPTGGDISPSDKANMTYV